MAPHPRPIPHFMWRQGLPYKVRLCVKNSVYENEFVKQVRTYVKQHHDTSAVVVSAEVRTGTLRDAMLYAAGANATHGIRRKNADKRNSIQILINDNEWSQWGDREIARSHSAGRAKNSSGGMSTSGSGR